MKRSDYASITDAVHGSSPLHNTLGEDRDYEAPEGADEGTIYFHPLGGDYDARAEHLFTTILPDAFARLPDLSSGQVGILYPAAWIGNAVAEAAGRHGFDFIPTDGKALYPRFSRVLRWLELCAVWSCNGWRHGDPRFLKLIAEANRIFGEALTSDEHKMAFQRNLLRFLWERRDTTLSLHDWLLAIRNEMLAW